MLAQQQRIMGFFAPPAFPPVTAGYCRHRCHPARAPLAHLCCCTAFCFFSCGPPGEMIMVLAEDNHLEELHHQTLQGVSISPTGMNVLPWMWIAPHIITSSRCYEAWRHMDSESPHLETWDFSGGIRAQAGPKGSWTSEAFSARQIHLTCRV